MKKYNAIIFDLDDTLILEEEYVKSGFLEIAKVISKKHNKNTENLYNDMFNYYKEGSKTVFNQLLEKYDIEYDEIYIRDIINTYREHLPNIALLSEGKEIFEFLKKKKYKLGIITDGYKESQLQKIKKLNLCTMVDKIIVTDLLGKKYWKPHRLPYYLMKKSLSTRYEEMIYIGDNEAKDFITAKKMGMKTIRIKRVNGIYYNQQLSSEYKADYEIMNLMEIISILEEEI